MFIYEASSFNGMGKIILISCVRRKKNYKTKAKNLYISPLFQYHLKYAESLNPDKIFILSAKYGLLELEKEVEPYEKTLNNMSAEQIKRWALQVILELKKVADLNKDQFIFLAGAKYRKYLMHHIRNFRIPLKGLPIGKQLKYLKQNTNSGIIK